MSVKNKAKDRDKNGRIQRKYTGKVTNPCPDGTPGWWVNLFMNRPKRRANKRLCQKVMAGDCAENMAFPPGSRKPHHYYW